MSLLFGGLVAILVIVILVKTARVVPQREQFVVERLGKFSKTLDAGFHILVPFVDSVAYKHTLKEQTFDVASQSCITQDNISVEIDGVIYMQVSDARAASYGIEDYRFAVSQLAQTTLRSEIGKIELDRTFEERETINAQVVNAVDRAAEPWGVKILRYEIKDIVPPNSVKDALEKQMRAERERRAVVAESEGARQARINVSEGDRQETINLSEAEKLKQINEAEGRAQEIRLIAEATASGIREVAQALTEPGGRTRLTCVLLSNGLPSLVSLLRLNNTMIVPAQLGDVATLVSTVMGSMETMAAQQDNAPTKDQRALDARAPRCVF